MTTNLAYNQNFLDDEEPIIRPATIFSSFVHFFILIVAIYGIPNFGRELPPDITVIPFDFLKVVEETNTEVNEKTYEEIEKKNNDKKKVIEEEKPEKKITPVIKKDPITENTIVQTKKPDLISKNTLPIEKPKIPVSPSKKPKLASEMEIPVKKPQKNTKILKVQKPIMKPQIKKEKIKKDTEKTNKTNPNALTTVLKTLEKIKDTNQQKKQKEHLEHSCLKSFKRSQVSRTDSASIYPVGSSITNISGSWIRPLNSIAFFCMPPEILKVYS